MLHLTTVQRLGVSRYTGGVRLVLGSSKPNLRGYVQSFHNSLTLWKVPGSVVESTAEWFSQTHVTLFQDRLSVERQVCVVGHSTGNVRVSVTTKRGPFWKNFLLF